MREENGETGAAPLVGVQPGGRQVPRRAHLQSRCNAEQRDNTSGSGYSSLFVCLGFFPNVLTNFPSLLTHPAVSCSSLPSARFPNHPSPPPLPVSIRTAGDHLLELVGCDVHRLDGPGVLGDLLQPEPRAGTLIQQAGQQVRQV